MFAAGEIGFLQTQDKHTHAHNFYFLQQVGQCL